jgi:hypothetical protein
MVAGSSSSSSSSIVGQPAPRHSASASHAHPAPPLPLPTTQVCALEAQLFEHLFQAREGPAQEALAQLMEPLGSCLYDALRPIFVQLSDVDQLCELIDILKHEVGLAAGWRPGEGAEGGGGAGAGPGAKGGHPW